MTQADATQRILSRINLPSGTPAPEGFILEIVIASLLGWLTQKCLNWWWPDRSKPPGWLARRRIDSLIYKACRQAESLPEADALHIDGADIYAKYGTTIRDAAIAVGREAQPGEWMRFWASKYKPMKPF